MKIRCRRWGVPTLALSLVVSLAAAPQRAEAAKPSWAAVPKDRSVPGAKAKLAPLPKDDPPAAPVKALAKPTWPAAGSATVELPAAATVGTTATADTARAAAPVRAGTLPVWLAPAAAPAGKAGGAAPAEKAATAAGPMRVRVDLLDHAALERTGLHGLAVRLAAQRGSGPASVSMDYGPFAGAFGADWATRLRFVPLPECALSTPELPQCRPGAPIATRNDVKTRRVTADLGASAAPTTYALLAGESGPGGDYSATSLSQSATWQVSPQTGAFSWSYEMDVPPGLNGPEPKLSLSYNSQGVDGRTASTNNQPSWVGEGFDLWSGYIERSYVSCKDDGSPGTGTIKRGDFCYAYDNATMSLNGSATELIPDGTGKYRPKNDDGSKIEHLTGASNGVKNGEYWKVTTADGTQYYFGRNQLPNGGPVTNSAWDVPVYSNNPGEPCYNANFDSAMCTMAWRWNLDYVVDPRGNALAYLYAKETNYYARNTKTSTAYTRGGYLTEARYGLRDSAPGAQAPMFVKFVVSERCEPTGTITCSDAQFTSANGQYWPDVPVDSNCKQGATCYAASPSFWSRKRLASVDTYVWNGAARPVDSWVLRTEFMDNDASTPSLWLDGITHKGKAVSGSELSLPEVTFTRKQLPNRVDGQENIPPMVKNRVLAITSESGGVTSVDYSDQDCAVGSFPAPDANTTRCYPTFWTPDGNTAATQDWFNKYVVDQVVQDDRIEGSTDDVTSYLYRGDPGWHFADDSGLVKPAEKTWSQWRGYGTVLVRDGASTEQQKETEYRYYRGMNGDRLANGGTRTATVVDSEGRALPDDSQLQGFTREEIERDGPGGTEISGKINDPWTYGPTATRTASWGTTSAYRVNITKVRTRVPLAAGGVRRTEATTTFNADGLPEVVDDAGDVAVSGDEKCTRNTYLRNDSIGMLAVPSRVKTDAVPCSAGSVSITGAAAAEQVISDELTSYDGQAFGVAPTKGLPTKTETLSAGSTYTTTERKVYDQYGRVTEEYDSLGNKSTTAYTPASGGPVTKTVSTDPKGFTTIRELDPGLGQETAEVSRSGKRTDFQYDGLGRLTKVWLPGRDKNSQTPSEEYGYRVGVDGMTTITTRQLRDSGSGYNESYEIYDGLQRPRQAQHPAPGGGRVVTDQFYDSRGNVVRKNDPYPNDQPASPDLFLVPDAQVPGQTRYVYDGAGRVREEIFLVNGVEKWRTSTSYQGNAVTVDPPDGETPTTTIVDAGGQTTELRQYQGDSPTGAYDSTRYTYTAEDEIATVTDPAGNVRRNNYDLRGRLVSTEEPDAGTTTYTYDDEDRITSKRDSRGRTITYNYDNLDRLVSSYEGGTQLTGYVYDTLVPGLVTSSTRYVDGKAYTVAVTGYDEADRPTGTRFTIPAEEGFGSTPIELTTGYNLDGTLAKEGFPALGGLPAETVRHEYDDLGMPTTTYSNLGSYVTETVYDKLAEMTRSVYSTGAKSVVRTYVYEEGTRRLKQTVTERDATPQRIGDTRYDYDKAGNITSIVEAPPGQKADNQCFDYDYLRRLVEAWTPGSGDCRTAPSVGGLDGPAPYWTSYTYDKVGNRTKEVQHSAAGDTTRTSTNPAAGGSQPHTLSSVAIAGPSGARTDTFAYDVAGNTTRRTVNGSTQALDWDVEGHLAKVTEGTKVTSYVYDASGNRLIRRDPSGTTLYLGNEELTVSGGKVSGLRYYQHAEDAVAVRTATGLSFLLSDHHNTDEMSVDATTMAVTQRRFDPFGSARGPQPQSWTGDRAFVGGTYDPSTGLTHLGAREYDPVNGRFISLDPVVDQEDPQQLHGYAYANNSPETYSDPDGKWFGSSLWKKAQAAYRAWLRWKAQQAAWRAWLIKKAQAAAKAALKKAKQMYRKHVPKSIRKVVHKVAQRVKKDIRTFKHVVKKAAKAVAKQAVAQAKAYKMAAKWAWAHKQQIYTVAKIVVGVVALFTCTICAIAGYAALAFSAYDTAAAGVKLAKDPSGQNFASFGFNVLGFATFGVASKYQNALQESKQLVKTTQAITGTASRADPAMGPAMQNLDHARVAFERARVVTGGYEFTHFTVNTIEDVKGSFNLRPLVGK
ncbi:RHS repeat-associated core domain-containing protein [Micromonospora sp. NPDC049559]|uniref:RHS repeat domain-containing protein n=1 Tax=Micromonospora sp. NPDC049559 TaxID=3155923 RepID=UPI0034375F1A